jgi:hypothetical protein
MSAQSVEKRTAFFSFLVRGFPDLPTSGGGGGGAGRYCWEAVFVEVDAKFSTLSTSTSRARSHFAVLGGFKSEVRLGHFPGFSFGKS